MTLPTRQRRQLALGLLAAFAIVATVPGVASAQASTKIVSVRSNGAQGKSHSLLSDVSRTGRFVAFDSHAPNLVKKDKNLRRDVFVRDMKTRKTTRVSVRSNGNEGSDSSFEPDITPDGRFVAFTSDSPNLVKGDDNGFSDVFVHDRRTGKTRRVSVRSGGGEAHGGGAASPSISDDGRFVAFRSGATDLVDGDTNGHLDVFVHDRKKKRTKRVSVATGGAQGLGGGSNAPVISGDGRYVAYHSFKENLVPGDNNGFVDIFLWDRKRKKTKLVSDGTGGQPANGGSSGAAISRDGRIVVYRSEAKNLIGSDTNDKADIFSHDRKSKKTRRVSRSSGGVESMGVSWEPRISASGRWVVFMSLAQNLVGNDSNGSEDVFVHDRKTKKTKRRSLRHNGKQINGESDRPAISGDGRFVTFRSDGLKVVKNDTNGWDDIFRRGPLR